jgi:hypothetical protein
MMERRGFLHVPEVSMGVAAVHGIKAGKDLLPQGTTSRHREGLCGLGGDAIVLQD